MRSVIAALKLMAFFVLSFFIVPAQFLLLRFHKGAYAYIIPQIWHKGVCFIFQIEVETRGNPIKSGQTLYVSNHLSYLDIPAIATVLRASFVAKKDVAKWPVFGFLSKLQQTAFIERKRGAAAKEATALGTMLADGKSLIIFPEGTSTDGQGVLPFKSSLFSLALNDAAAPLTIQPFTIQVKEVNGTVPKTQELRDIYAWHRDMDTELPRHLWLFAKSKGAKITLTFQPVTTSSAFKDRKTLAKHCHEAVSKGVEHHTALAG